MRLSSLDLRHVATLASVVLVGVVAGCDESVPTPQAPMDLRAIEADNITYGLRTFLSQNGIRSGTVRADSAYQFSDSSRSYLWEMDMTLFYEDGRDRANIRADSAVLNTRTEELTARGNVVAEVMDEGMRIESSELHYDPTGEQIWSDSSVVLSRDGAVQRGTCFRSDLQFSNWEICNPVGDIINEGDAGSGGSDTGEAQGEAATVPDAPGPAEPLQDPRRQ